MIDVDTPTGLQNAAFFVVGKTFCLQKVKNIEGCSCHS